MTFPYPGWIPGLALQGPPQTTKIDANQSAIFFNGFRVRSPLGLKGHQNGFSRAQRVFIEALRLYKDNGPLLPCAGSNGAALEHSLTKGNFLCRADRRFHPRYLTWLEVVWAGQERPGLFFCRGRYPNPRYAQKKHWGCFQQKAE